MAGKNYAMRDVLVGYLSRLETGDSHQDAVMYLARKFSHDPWVVVGQVGLLARCSTTVADRDLGLNAALETRRYKGRASLVDVAKGQRYPVPKNFGRKAKGAYDTPRVLSHRVVREALEACQRSPKQGLDIACGTGSLLLALHEAGVPELVGFDIDPLALSVARVAVPAATLICADGLDCQRSADVVVGNPPFVSSEHQGPGFRTHLRSRFPWLSGRFDLSVPFAAKATECGRTGAGLGLILPQAVLVQPYGRPLRERCLKQHLFQTISEPVPFPGVSVDICIVAMTVGMGPGPVPPSGLDPRDLAQLPLLPLGTPIRQLDLEIVRKIRAHSVPLGEIGLVDTGVVAHLPGGSRERLISDEPGENLVPYADAKDYFDGRRRWLDYRPELMHRAKNREMFERPKIVVQRIRGKGSIKARVDRSGVFVGHTCTVVQPNDDIIPLERLLELICSPLVAAVMKIERGQTMDLYPREVASFPVPTTWLRDSRVPLKDALGLTASDQVQLGRWVSNTEKC